MGDVTVSGGTIVVGGVEMVALAWGAINFAATSGFEKMSSLVGKGERKNSQRTLSLSGEIISKSERWIDIHTGSGFIAGGTVASFPISSH